MEEREQKRVGMGMGVGEVECSQYFEFLLRKSPPALSTVGESSVSVFFFYLRVCVRASHEHSKRKTRRRTQIRLSVENIHKYIRIYVGPHTINPPFSLILYY